MRPSRLLRFARNDSASADAIVVLGARLRPDGVPSTTVRRRVALGVQLYQQGAAPLLVMSGGGRSSMPEAEIMVQLAETAGVLRAALLVEGKSRNTFENALFSARLLQALNCSRIILVSNRVHLPRAALLFRLAGLNVVGSAGAPLSSWTAALAAVLHEIAALPRSLIRILAVRG